MIYLTELTDDNAAKTESQKIKLIHKQVQAIRLSERMGVKYMQACY